jgi:hypothetical protein
MASLEFLAIILTGLGLIVSILYYTSVLQNANKTRKLQLRAQELATETRQAQLFMNIYNHWNTSDFWKNYWSILDREWTDYDDYQSKYGRKNSLEANANAATLFAFYEGLGVLVKRGLIDPHFVDDLLGGTIINYWEKMEPIYVEMRVRTNYPQIATQIEFLYETIRPIATLENLELLEKESKQ